MTPVSVIIPVYNMQDYLGETLDSILASDYPDLEIVVMDDGSTDNSLAIARKYATADPRVIVFSQPNSGVCAARNNAIRRSRGTYILPVDADNRIAPDYVRLAATTLDNHPEISVVAAEAEFFGKRTGRWHLPPFSLSLLARKNIIDTCAMYRRTDWERTGGYCEDFTAREDWDFWLSVFAGGGGFYRIPKTGFYYRVRSISKRVTDRSAKRELIRRLNNRHEAFFEKHLGGPLHYHRSWSRFLNCFRSVRGEGDFREWHKGEVIHSGRNTVTRYGTFVIKSFGIPHFLQAVIYGLLRKSKARRSYEYALRIGDITPAPIAYRETRVCGLLRESYYVSVLSSCTHTVGELIAGKLFPDRNVILRRVGEFTARLHEHGIYHADYSQGNILFSDDASKIQIVDLNRLRFYRHIGIRKGCRNFERLDLDRDALAVMAAAYAEVRGFDPQLCEKLIISMRWHKHHRKQ